MLKFKVNDKVLVLTGKSKNQIGIIKKIIKHKIIKNKTIVYKYFIILEGINFIKKHVKANPNKNKTGGIINIESSIAFSNIMLINPKTNKKDKIFFSLSDNKKKYRVFKSNSEVLT